MNKITFISIERRFFLALSAVIVAIFIVSSATAYAARPVSLGIAPQTDTAAESAPPAWLEPRPLSVVDLINAGMDPAIFVGAPITWRPVEALLQFVSGSKSGSKITVKTKVLPTFASYAFCLGQEGFHDHWSIVSPASTVRIRSNGRDITNKVVNIRHTPADYTLPVAGSGNIERYPHRFLTPEFDASGRLKLPSNMGCQIFFEDGAADGGNLELDFEHDLTQHISAQVLESFDHEFKSFYSKGEPNFGSLLSLNNQLVALNGGNSRHDYFKFVPPAEANYILMVFPPTSIDVFAPLNLIQTHKRYEGSGSYRFRETGQPFTDLSVDWTTMAGIPMNFHAKDADFSAGQKYLDFFKETEDYRFHAPEVVAINNDYHPCMTNGGCTEAFLRTISATRMNVKIYYLKVDRIAPGLTQIPLCAVGPAWTPSDVNQKCNTFRVSRSVGQDPILDERALEESGSAIPNPFVGLSAPSADILMDHFVYLPFISRALEPEPDNPTADCPCGWFAEDGRMLGYVEPPGS